MAAPREEPDLGRLDLRALDLSSGAAAHVVGEVPVENLTLGGQRYRVESSGPARVDVSEGSSGRLFRLRLDADLVGPCWRCLEEARAHVRIDAREYQAAGRPPDAPHDEDLDTQYLEGHVLDVAGWARDAVAEALPPTILCREACAGLCPTCGTDLNAGPCDCPPPEPDSRWAALGPLAERLRREG
jgi:DUF177 domain-containing protein